MNTDKRVEVNLLFRKALFLWEREGKGQMLSNTVCHLRELVVGSGRREQNFTPVTVLRLEHKMLVRCIELSWNSESNKKEICSPLPSGLLLLTGSR